MKYKIAILALIILLSGCLNNGYEYIDGEVTLGDVVVSVAVADEPQEQATGLMHRESMGRKEGMLFVFSSEDTKSFWMRNTLIPLDMIFIGEDLEIKKIHSAEPCERDPCMNYNSGKEVLYVLEVNKGFAEKYDVEEGDKVEIKIY